MPEITGMAYAILKNDAVNIVEITVQPINAYFSMILNNENG